MKKTRRRYDREFKISVVAELESGKPPSQIARELSKGLLPVRSSFPRLQLPGVKQSRKNFVDRTEPIRYILVALLLWQRQASASVVLPRALRTTPL